jgi:tripartite-type tricarboxylate transporter receptor subunit TctC
MDTQRRRMLCACLLATAARPTRAAGYPDRPIRLIVPSSPGGGADAVARAFATQLERRLEQPVVVENIAGASGARAARAAARARPDGYTLMVGATSDLVTTPLVAKDAGYSRRSFTPIALLIRSPMVLLAGAAVDARSVRELLQRAPRHRGGWVMGLSGASGLSAFAVAAIAQDSGARFVTVPYQGAAPAMLALLRAEVDLCVQPLSVALPHVQGEKVKALAVLSAQRVPWLPDVPAWRETGTGRDLAIEIWAALVGPAGLPPQVVGTLDGAVRSIVSDPAFTEQRGRQGESVAQPMPAEQLHAFLEREHEAYSMLAALVRGKQ